jgi:hypothetical protein
MPAKKGKKPKSKPRTKKSKSKSKVTITQNAKVIVSGSGGEAGGCGGSSGGGGAGGTSGAGGQQYYTTYIPPPQSMPYYGTYGPPPPSMPPQPPWQSGPGYPVERAERAEYNEHGVAGASKMPSVNHAHNDMSLADQIKHQQQPPFPLSALMETDEPTQPYSACVPRNEGGGENSFAVPPIVKMSLGTGTVRPGGICDFRRE